MCTLDKSLEWGISKSQCSAPSHSFPSTQVSELEKKCRLNCFSFICWLSACKWNVISHNSGQKPEYVTQTLIGADECIFKIVLNKVKTRKELKTHLWQPEVVCFFLQNHCKLINQEGENPLSYILKRNNQ